MCVAPPLVYLQSDWEGKKKKPENINDKNSCGNDSHSVMYMTVSFPQNIQNHSGKSVAIPTTRDIHGVMSFSTADYPSAMPNTVSLVTQFFKKKNNIKRIGRREERWWHNAPFCSFFTNEENKLIISFDVGRVGGTWRLGVRKSNSHCYYSNRNPIYMACLFLVFDGID